MDHHQADHKRILDLFKKDSILDLPVGIFLATLDGQFIYANPMLRQILNIEIDVDISKFVICDFYKDKDDLKRVLEELSSGDGVGKLMDKRIIPIVIDGKNRFVQLSCKTMSDPIEPNKRLAYMGCVIDVSEEAEYHKVFEDLPIGIFRLDVEDRVVLANQAYANIYGYKRIEDVLGKDVTDFALNRNEVKVFSEKAREMSGPVTQQIKLINPNGDVIYTTVCAQRLEDPEGTFVGRQGAIIDTKSDGFVEDIASEIPIGFCLAKEERGGTPLIQRCNDYFVNMFDLITSANAIGMDFQTLFPSEEVYGEYRRRVWENTKEGGKFLMPDLVLKTQAGTIKHIEGHFSVIHDDFGRVHGQLGVFIDRTYEVGLRNQIRELTTDVGKVFHSFSSMLAMLIPIIDSSIKFYTKKEFDTRYHRRLGSDEIMDIIHKPANNVVEMLTRFVNYVKSQNRVSAFGEKAWDLLVDALEGLKENIKIINAGAILHVVLRDTLFEIHSILSEARRNTVAKELYKHTLTEITSLIGTCNLISLYSAREAVLEQDHQVRELREFVLSGKRTTEAPKRVFLAKLIDKARQVIQEFAKSRKVDLRVRTETGLFVVVQEQELIRALINLMHNAVKYSWYRRESLAWVDIRTERSESGFSIIIQNWGVPIPEQEVVSQRIFEFGYRGRLSSDRSRPGSGIGLFVARQIVEEHGGRIRISSRPANSTGDPKSFHQPFVTKVFVELPNRLIRE